MNSKQVLNKIMTLLNIQEVELAYARLEDGTMVQSPSFDVGEALTVVSEDGTEIPAPDGWHDLKLGDTEGEETYFKVRTEDGFIVERENVEMEEDEEEVEMEAETVEVQDIPQANNDTDESNKAETLPNSVEMEEEEIEEEIDMKKKYDEMSIRIEELEATVKELIQKITDTVEEEEEMEEEEELPKLDGAPVEEQRFSATTNKTNYGKKVTNAQSTFLSKLYK